MKVEFLGAREMIRKGCGVCGGRRASEYSFQRERRVILPSGRIKTFRLGQAEDVSADEGAFLLSLSSAEKPMFREV